MELSKGIDFVKFSDSDVAQLAVIMKRAFDEDTRRHLGEGAGGPPGYDNGEFLTKWYLNSGAEAYKVQKDGKIIGGICVFINNNRENFLGNMFIDPLYQDRGIGTAVWKFIEQKFPDTKIWRTETPGFSKRNHNFYINKCGFKVVKIENPKDKYEESYMMEKEM